LQGRIYRKSIDQRHCQIGEDIIGESAMLIFQRMDTISNPSVGVDFTNMMDWGFGPDSRSLF
jgi:hypothetical protein